jgi:capsular polysaccharide biosynthesis protein
LKIKYYSLNKKIFFYNARYLTHIQQNNKNHYLSSTIKNLNKAIHDNYSFKNKKKIKYILVSRKNSSRNLLNENELYEKIKKYGFQRFHFEELSSLDQIEISFNSKIMIGYHGSGLTNLIFMKPNSYVVDIMNENYQNPVMKILCMNKKINYIRSLCEISYKDLGGVCNINLLDKKIKSLI